jgi:GGDEF domain-containing protein
VIVLDIDYFKQYNDHYGHIKGDECLRRVARTLSLAANRPRDFIARIGGEEFVWLLPETDAESARLVANKCLHLIRQQQIPPRIFRGIAAAQPEPGGRYYPRNAAHYGTGVRRAGRQIALSGQAQRTHAQRSQIFVIDKPGAAFKTERLNQGVSKHVRNLQPQH